MQLNDLPDNHDHTNLFRSLQHVKNWGCAVDVGAHRGTWTNVLVEKFNVVHAFEPGPLHSQISKKAIIHNVALSDLGGFGRLLDGDVNSGQRHLEPNNISPNIDSGNMIPIHTLDDYMLQFSNLGFLKIDVEGLELKVLQGGEMTINAYRPVIIFEENGLCSRYGIDPGATKSWLISKGYVESEKINKDIIMVSN